MLGKNINFICSEKSEDRNPRAAVFLGTTERGLCFIFFIHGYITNIIHTMAVVGCLRPRLSADVTSSSGNILGDPGGRRKKKPAKKSLQRGGKSPPSRSRHFSTFLRRFFRRLFRLSLALTICPRLRWWSGEGASLVLYVIPYKPDIFPGFSLEFSQLF